MKVKTHYILFLFLVAQIVSTESFAIFASIMKVVSFGGEWGLAAFTGFLGFHGSEVLYGMLNLEPDKHAELMEEVKRGFEKLNHQISTSSEVIVSRLSHQIHANVEFSRVFHRIEEYLLTIGTQFKNLQQLVRSNRRFQNETLYKTADYLTSSADGTVQSAMYKLDSIINDHSISSQLSRGTITAIINYLKAMQDVKHCETITAPIEVMYVFLHYLSMMQLKGMVTIQEAFNLLARISMKDHEYYAAEFQRIEQATAEHLQKLLEHMDKLKLLSPYSYACMPQEYVEHKNYERFEKFLPIYLVDEYGLEHYWKKINQYLIMFCSEDCPWYDLATFHPNPKQKRRLNYRHRCWGLIHSCKQAHISEKICVEPPNSTRLYSKYTESCELPYDATPVRYEWYMCHICHCNCDTHVGQNFVYIAPIMAQEGHVVTGVRFEKRNNAIMLNIETAGALPFAFANQTDAKWKESLPLEQARLNRDRYFHMFHWCRHFVLSDVRVAKDQVVVGVQLYPVPGKRCAFNLRVFGRQINILNGKFTKEGVVAHTTKIDNSTQVIDVSDLLSGVDKTPQNTTTPENGPKLIKLSNSALNDELGQNTLPYFDTQDVTTSPRMMQGGVSFYYRTTEKYAGFVAPRLIAFNTMEYLKTIERKPEVIKEQLSLDVEAGKKLAKKSKLEGNV